MFTVGCNYNNDYIDVKDILTTRQSLSIKINTRSYMMFSAGSTLNYVVIPVSKGDVNLSQWTTSTNSWNSQKNALRRQIVVQLTQQVLHFMHYYYSLNIIIYYPEYDISSSWNMHKPLTEPWFLKPPREGLKQLVLRHKNRSVFCIYSRSNSAMYDFLKHTKKTLEKVRRYLLNCNIGK